MTDLERASGTIRVYACGGCGINLGKKLALQSDSRLDIAYIDSSNSNLSGIGTADQTYLIENMDGAGKLREKTYEAYQSEVQPTLTMFPPSKTLNIVISSLSGGTGSMIAPLLVRELLARDQIVIVIAIPTFTSTIELKNTIGTLKTYNNFSVRAGKPIAMAYCDTGRRSEVDNEVMAIVDLFALITNRSKTEEFDAADLYNYVNYHLVTKGIPVGITRIMLGRNRLPNMDDHEVVNLEGESSKAHINRHIVSSILVTADRDSEFVGVKPEYPATVIITDENFVNNDKRTDDIRVDNVVGVLPELLAKVEQSYKDANDRLETARINTIEVVTTDDDVVF